MAVSTTGSRDAPIPFGTSTQTIETGESWVVAGIVLLILTFSYGTPLVVVVSLKPIAEELASPRSIPALANSLAWLGAGTGAMAFGWLAERAGIGDFQGPRSPRP